MFIDEFLDVVDDLVVDHVARRNATDVQGTLQATSKFRQLQTVRFHTGMNYSTVVAQTLA